MAKGYMTCPECKRSKPYGEFPVIVKRYKSGRALVVIRKRSKACRACWDKLEEETAAFAVGLFSEFTKGEHP